MLEFQLQHQSFQRIFRTDFFRMDLLDLLEVQGTLKSLLQHHRSKASILQHSVFFIVYLSHPYMTTGKTITLTRRTFVAGSQCEDLPLWQRSWGRRLGICKGGIEPQETPCSPASTPKNQRLPTLLLYFLTYTSDFMGGCPPPPLSEKELTYSSS